MKVKTFYALSLFEVFIIGCRKSKSFFGGCDVPVANQDVPVSNRMCLYRRGMCLYTVPYEDRTRGPLLVVID